MANNAPAQKRDRSAPFSQTFTTAQASLTNLVPVAAVGGTPGTPRVAPYLNPTSGMVLIALTAAAVVLTWKDCAGTVNTISYTATLAGQSIDLPVAATTLDTVTNCAVVCYWHGSGNALASG